MNKEKQRIAIAEACGIVSKDKWGSLYKTPRGTLRDCPDYLTDLNAMHEAEKVLTDDDHKTYRSWLVVVCYGQHWLATAEKRAEAFLRTIGKWEEL